MLDGIADTKQGPHRPCTAHQQWMKFTWIRKSFPLTPSSPLPLIFHLDNSDVLALPDKKGTFKLKCHLLVKKLSYVFHS